jgi:hypothetical protein
MDLLHIVLAVAVAEMKTQRQAAVVMGVAVLAHKMVAVLAQVRQIAVVGVAVVEVLMPMLEEMGHQVL